jgi:hypothetical protein
LAARGCSSTGEVAQRRQRDRLVIGKGVVAAQQRALWLAPHHVSLEPGARGRAAHQTGIEGPSPTASRISAVAITRALTSSSGRRRAIASSSRGAVS